MRVILEMELEMTANYDSRALLAEIKKLIFDKDRNTRIVRFRMQEKYGEKE